MNKKMKIVVGIIIIIMISCVIGKIILENRTIDLEGTISGIDYKISYSDEYANRQFHERGFFIDTLNQPNSPYWYIITMGMQATGGYDIKIVNVKIDKDKNVEVIVKEITPSSDTEITVVTCPTCCLELSEGAETIVIKNTKGEIFNKLN